MKQILLGVLFFVLVNPLAQARPEPDEVGVCYQFKDDKLIDMGVCVISAGNGAGAMYVNLKFDGKQYLYERPNDYIRNTFHEKVTNAQDLDYLEKYAEEDMIYCYKDKPYDICHN